MTAQYRAADEHVSRCSDHSRRPVIIETAIISPIIVINLCWLARPPVPDEAPAGSGDAGLHICSSLRTLYADL